MNKFLLKVKDRPGTIPVEVMQKLFEQGINETLVLKDRVDLRRVYARGGFQCYADGETDALWLGFSLGLRCAERMEGGER